MADQGLQERIDSILSIAGAPLFRLPRLQEKPRPLFSAFVESHVMAAWDLVAEFTRLADTAEGLSAAVRFIEGQTREQTLVGLVQYAVMLFELNRRWR